MKQKYNIYAGREYITQIEARSDTKAQRMADILGKRYQYGVPMFAIPSDPAIQPYDRHTMPIVYKQKGKVIQCS